MTTQAPVKKRPCNTCGETNCQWQVTVDFWYDKDIKEGPVTDRKSYEGVTNRQFDAVVEMPYQWRTCGDDGPKEGLSYRGVSSQQCLAPLDDLGMPDCGDTIIQYYDPKTKKWETIN